MKRVILGLICSVLAATLLFFSGCSATPDDAIPVTEPEKVTDAVQATEETATEATKEVLQIDITPPEFAFADGNILCGTDIGGLTGEEAYAAICDALAQHTIKVTVNGKQITLDANDLGLECSREDILAYAAALEAGTTPSIIPTITCNTSGIRSKIASGVNVSAKNASVRYNVSTDQFEIVSEKNGSKINMNSVMKEVEPAICSLASAVTVKASTSTVYPTIFSDDEAVINAVPKANEYLSISLTYTYTPDGGETKTETISRDTIGSLISFNSKMEPYVSKSTLQKYVRKMDNKYGVDGEKGKFKTSGGYHVNLKVSYSGQPVDTDALYSDIKYCLDNGISGTRTAPYKTKDIPADMAYNGNYVEVDLSSQHLWVYKNGKCVVSTPIVSGCVYKRDRTPTGVFDIDRKVRSCYLVGKDYKDWVEYWMPFHRAYGMHDASWRDTFGGDEYLYNGSHGCVNIPSDVAGSVYKNVSVGTKVIIYGGASSASPITQKIQGTTAYTVSTDTKPFTLDAKLAYGSTQMHYSSDNPSVAEVSSDGVVTVKAAGNANITVSVPKQDYYTSAELVVKITVERACGDSHDFGEWVQTKAPSCTAGEETRTCICGKKETRPIDPVQEHSYGDWVQTKAPSCAPGEQTRTCACGKTETRPVDPVQEHSYGEWVTVKDPGCGSSGKKSAVCSSCGHEKTESIPATGEHNFASGGATCDNGCGAENPSYEPPESETQESN